MNTSYFKVASGHIVFFNDYDLEDTTRAFDLARAAGNGLCVYRIPRVAGPWARLPIIGHRHRGMILMDIQNETDQERRYWLQEELSHLDREYLAAGVAA